MQGGGSHERAKHQLGADFTSFFSSGMFGFSLWTPPVVLVFSSFSAWRCRLFCSFFALFLFFPSGSGRECASPTLTCIAGGLLLSFLLLYGGRCPFLFWHARRTAHCHRRGCGRKNLFIFRMSFAFYASSRYVWFWVLQVGGHGRSVISD